MLYFHIEFPSACFKLARYPLKESFEAESIYNMIYRMHEIFFQLVGESLPSSQDQEQCQANEALYNIVFTSLKPHRFSQKYSQKIIGNPMITPDTEDVHFRDEYRLVGK